MRGAAWDSSYEKVTFDECFFIGVEEREEKREEERI